MTMRVSSRSQIRSGVKKGLRVAVALVALNVAVWCTYTLGESAGRSEQLLQAASALSTTCYRQLLHKSAKEPAGR
jgi:hypothetical protein